MKPILTLATVGAALAFALPAFAHVTLVKATPAVKAAVAAPALLELEFSGKVEPKFSGFELTRGDGAKVALTPLPPAKDGKRLSAKPAQPLRPGAYKIAWHIVSADGHRMTGGHEFSVR